MASSSHHRQPGKRGEAPRQCPCKNLPQSLSSFTAAEFGDLRALSRLGPAVASRVDIGGCTPLHYAAQHDRTASVSLLLSLGADIDGRASEASGEGVEDSAAWPRRGRGGGDAPPPRPCGATPLHRASFSGAVSSMRVLIEWGSSSPSWSGGGAGGRRCNLLARDVSFGDGMTPLHKAAAGGRYLAVRLLIDALRERGGLREGLEEIDAGGHSALRVAIDLKKRSEEGEGGPEVSGRRWDAVAGHSADWGRCADLLSAAEGEDGLAVSSSGASLPSGTTAGGRITLLPPMPPLPEHLSGMSAASCLDCGEDDDGQCKTSSWESAFRTILKSSTEETLRAQQARESRNGAKEQSMNTPLPPKAGVSTPKLDDGKGTLTSSYESMKVQTRSTISASVKLGSNCSHCGLNSLALFRGKGNVLLCKKCRKLFRR